MQKLHTFKFRWLVWHRRIGIVTCLGVFLWGISGMSHPIMSRLQPAPVAFSAPAQQIHLSAIANPTRILSHEHIARFTRLSIVDISGKSYFRISENSNKPARYFAADKEDGIVQRELINGDEIYAKQLAKHYTGLPESSITNARYITEFNEDYLPVNQILPVWKVEFTGGQHLRAYVDTDQARLSTLIDDTRSKLTKLFRFGHNWSFAEQLPRAQLTIMALALFLALFSACSGLYLYVRQRHHVKQRLIVKPLRRWHRRLGLIVAISTLLFATSGLIHLIISYQQQHRALVTKLNGYFLTKNLSDLAWQQLGSRPVNKIDLVGAVNNPMWLIQDAMPKAHVAALSQEHEHHHEHSPSATSVNGMSLINATDSHITISNVIDLAKAKAAVYANQLANQIVNAEMINKFEGEYGFFFKRLPVVKVQFKGEGNPRYYIEPSTGVLAAKITDSDALEGWIFAYIHKWNFISFNHDLRDFLAALFALGNVMVAFMGMLMFANLGKKSKSV